MMFQGVCRSCRCMQFLSRPMHFTEDWRLHAPSWHHVFTEVPTAHILFLLSFRL